ncbi:OmpA family protein [Runella sp. MFBS21]|uniref:OmpA family protein n=1 Tax=Runella sp. MFBS21 TaxID=3034018 RepID=UPI0023F6FBA1|nr:OmpA family protein [Runella sp. MFBS21]MDF7819266.1 OmpA family protein [Runella sp. MFBS21]
MKKINLLSTLLIVSLALTKVDAQAPAPKSAGYEGPNKLNTWALTITPALTQFYGDLRQHDFKLGPEEHLTGGLGLGLHKQITPIFGASLNFWTGNLNGSKERLYNAHFETKGFLQSSINAHANLKPILFGYNKLKRWKWDVYVGYGYMWYNSRVYRLGTNKSVELIRTNTNASSKTAGEWERDGSTYTREIVFPIGSAIHFEVSPRIDIGLDFTLNHVNSEKLDVTYGGGGGEQYARQDIWLFNKGDSKQDKWGSIGLGITYKIGKSAVMAKKDAKGNWVHDPAKGRYHLRYTNPLDLIAPPYNPTMNDADSIAKANMPKPVDPRLYTDSDGDGVADLFDKEPSTPANSIVSGGGVAMDLEKYIKDIIAKNLPKEECEAMFGNIEFDTDKAIIKDPSQQILKQVIDLLNLRPNCRAVIIGHTDARASDNYNIQLSKRRVEAAKRYMIRNGMQDPSRIMVEYYGELRPISDNKSAVGMSRNRRVEIRILPMNDLRSPYPAGFRTGRKKDQEPGKVAKEPRKRRN